MFQADIFFKETCAKVRFKYLLMSQGLWKLLFPGSLYFLDSVLCFNVLDIHGLFYNMHFVFDALSLFLDRPWSCSYILFLFPSRLQSSMGGVQSARSVWRLWRPGGPARAVSLLSHTLPPWQHPRPPGRLQWPTNSGIPAGRLLTALLYSFHVRLLLSFCLPFHVCPKWKWFVYWAFEANRCKKRICDGGKVEGF